MGTLIVRTWGDDGQSVTYVSADSTNGDFCPVDGTTLLTLKNRGSSTITVTVPRVASSHGFQTALVMSVPSGTTRQTPVLDPAHFGHRPTVTYSAGAAANLDVACARVVGVLSAVV